MMVTVLPSKLGSFLSASLLWGANRSVAICWAVSMAAPKVSRLWSAKRGRWVSPSTSSHSNKIKSRSRRERMVEFMGAEGSGDKPADARPAGRKDSLQDFEQAGRALAAADAHGHHDILDAAALAFDQGVAHQAGARHTVRMADGNRAAVDVEAVHRDAERVRAVQHLHGKGFVQFPQADVGHRQARFFQQLGHGVDGADAH